MQGAQGRTLCRLLQHTGSSAYTANTAASLRFHGLCCAAKEHGPQVIARAAALKLRGAQWAHALQHRQAQRRAVLHQVACARGTPGMGSLPAAQTKHSVRVLWRMQTRIRKGVRTWAASDQG